MSNKQDEERLNHDIYIYIWGWWQTQPDHEQRHSQKRNEITAQICKDNGDKASSEFSHEGVVGHAGPGHVAEGPAGQSFGSREVAEREGQNHRQTPDTDDHSCGGLCWQTRLQGMYDGHVPACQRSQRIVTPGWSMQTLQNIFT